MTTLPAKFQQRGTSFSNKNPPKEGPSDFVDLTEPLGHDELKTVPHIGRNSWSEWIGYPHR